MGRSSSIDTPRMRSVMNWVSFYRANPHRFAKDYLNLNLKKFQQIILVMMNICVYFMFFASRGLGKTYLVAVFCCIRSILYPNTKICVASKTLQQAKEVLKKITGELMPNSPNLRCEIEKVVINSGDAFISFKNGSQIFVVVAGDSARGKRCNILIVDEFRLVNESVIDIVLKNFLRAERYRPYMSKPEYKDYEEERNKEIYMTSPWLKSHWSYNKAQSYVVDLLNENKSTFICGLPYQLAIKEGLLNRAQVEDEMSEATFNEIGFSMESECLFWGEGENTFFKYDELLTVRKIKDPIYPREVYGQISEKLIKYPQKQVGEVRVLCADIAVMSSKRNHNDATAIFILQLSPTPDGQYIRNVVYSENYEGGNSGDQAVLIRRLYEQLDCDYIVIDSNGVGMGCFDALVTDLLDETTGVTYPALQCMNDEEMAAHYKGLNKTPPKVIYSIKASAKFNSICAMSLRDCIRRSKIRLLLNENEYEDIMNSSKAYRELSLEDKMTLKLPHIQTSLLINELVNLEYQMNGTEIKIKETGTNRKDRYSALSYGNYFANELERKLKKPRTKGERFELPMRAPVLRGGTNRW